MTEKELILENVKLKQKNEWLESENSRLQRIIYELQREVDSNKSQVDCSTIEHKDREKVIQDYIEKKLNTSIYDLGLSNRALFALMYLGCENLRDIISHRPEDFYELRNCGKKTVDEIVSIAKKEGFEMVLELCVDNN